MITIHIIYIEGGNILCLKKIKKTIGSFILKILNGAIIAIVVALIPNAILATFFKQFASNPLFANWLHIVQVFQFFTPIMAGYLISMQFKLNPIQSSCVGGAAFIGSGAWKYVEVTLNGNTANIFQLAGIGDVINTMLTAAIAILVVRLISAKLGSLNLVLLPIIVGTGVGHIGTLTLPYVSMITALISQGINTFTTLQPFLMSILIAMSFSIIIISPLSTVAIGLGAMKMMIPNFLTHPIIGLPVMITATISSLSVLIFQMVGTPASAGFGFVGLVSPLAALNAGNINIVIMLLSWIVVPFVVAFIVNKVCCDVLHLYKKEIFTFKG